MSQSGTSVSIVSIAERAGVSKTTVGYVLSGQAEKRKVSPKTARKVLEIAKEMNYMPNLWAKRLASQKTNLVSFLFNELSFGMADRVMEGALEVIDAKDYSSFLAVHFREPEREKREIMSVIQRRDEGVICCPVPGGESRYEMLIKQKVPFVFLSDTLETMPDASFVAWDVAPAARVALEYLVKTGRKKIALISSDFQSWSTKLRCSVYRSFLDEAGFEFREEWLGIEGAGCSPNYVVENMFSQNEKPDAILATDDAIALQVMSKLENMGFSLPDDIGLVGLGDSPFSSHSKISLTTVREPVEEIGREAVNVLFDLIDNPDSGPIQKLVKGSELKIRNSA